MSHHDEQHGTGEQHGEQHGTDEQQGTEEQGGAAVSEAGSSSLNPGAALGGADAVPDTPDVNDTGEADRIDISEQGQGDRQS